MLYPGNAKKEYHKEINYANRGMDLEALINDANKYYYINDLAIIYKKPTPITINHVEYPNNQKVITKATFKRKSTLDYVGLYQGKYLDFDTKSTTSKTSFTLNNIAKHQLEHIKKVISHGGISFLIISINNQVYLFKGEDLIYFIENEKRKSITLNYLKEKGYLIPYSFNPILNYLKVINNVYFKTK